MDQVKQGKVVIKEPCGSCGAKDYIWSALPMDEVSGETLTQVPEACSNCHDLDEENNIRPKVRLN